ncbi:glycosyltransferase family 39 protein [Bradyrhizobium sp. AUGA SZCCT0283]|uniref:glycosyltransferase family 39 protein n=1 Tax=Bradyrhizobium sp. AUGA SZCCT0283 TaxID=2807671 RepID=UPI001BA636E2|nr:glycosyltransferase family 39 protein [Bradyrhizobium sp. AUGA SZCCT0283]MBR1273397.1 glycosyltransferase family 39 protein [Bradyrhizobium sp. AUGA SZCCT0283]
MSKAALLFTAALPLTLVAAVAVFARTWQLSQNDFGRQYYAAGVRSMLGSWHNFLFNSFDPAGFVSIDKPPVAIWLQAASAKLFGFSALSILLAQVMAGLAAVLIIYVLVRKYWGGTAGTTAALSLALSPINVAVDRSNNTESCLILALLAGVWLGMRAAETGRLTTFCAAMAAIGVGFNVKMGTALVLAPVLALTFSLARPGAPITWHVQRQAIAGIVLVAVSLSWAIFFDLTPAQNRPYAGSTKHNSMLELALVHNGAARFVAMSAPAANPAISSPAASGETAPATTAVRQPVMTDDSPTGPLRLFRPRAAAQFAWLLPLALAGLVLAWSDACGPGAPVSRRIGAGVWTGWLVMYWIVLSFAGGLIHTYYVAVLGPPLAVFSGIAVAGLWSRWKAGKPGRTYLPLIIVATAAWQIYLCMAQSETVGSDWLSLTWLTSIGIAAIGAAVLYAWPQQGGRLARLFAVASIGALLAAPILTTASVVLRRPNIAAPVANMTALLTPSDTERVVLRTSRLEAARQKLTSYLVAHREAAKFLVAVPNANVAAPLIIQTGLPVMAIGGYLGDDPILTPSDVERLASDRQLRFVMLGGFTLAPAKQAAALDPIARWVRANGRPVDPKLWRLSASAGAPYRINLGNEWVEVPPPELFDLWDNASRDLPGEAARQQLR